MAAADTAPAAVDMEAPQQLQPRPQSTAALDAVPQEETACMAECFNEPYTARRVRVACPYCRRGACRACQIKYVLSEALDPHCMSCKRAWPTDVLDTLFPRSFRRGELRRHNIRMLMARERAFFPATQAVLEEAQRILQTRPFYLTLNEVLRTAWAAHDVGAAADAESEAGPAAAARAAPVVPPCPAALCNGFLSSAWKCGTCGVRVCRRCEAVRTDAGAADAGAADAEHAAEHEGEPEAGPDAGSSSGGGGARRPQKHACNPDDVASVQLKRNDTKQCPRCPARIQRISGCPQMFCVACHTAFDWVTLRIITGGIHNPHYQEYMAQLRARTGGGARAGGAPPADGACEGDAADRARWPWNHIAELHDGLAHADEVRRSWLAYAARLAASEPAQVQAQAEAQAASAFDFTVPSRPLNTDDAWGPIRELAVINRLLMERHERAYTIRGMGGRPQYSERTYRTLRIQRLRGAINDTQWGARLSYNETLRAKSERMDAPDLVLVNVGADLIRRALRESRSYEDILEAEAQLEQLRLLTNEQRHAAIADHDDKFVALVSPAWDMMEPPPMSRNESARLERLTLRKQKRGRAEAPTAPAASANEADGIDDGGGRLCLVLE